MKKIWYLLTLSLLVLLCNCHQTSSQTMSEKKDPKETKVEENKPSFQLSDEEWKKRLSPEAYKVLRLKGTESPYTNKYDHHFETGSYNCAGCATPLFRSDNKYNSGCGWPAFYDALDKSKILEIKDVSYGMVRVEVVCKNCHGHLGHVFPDGPKDKTGMRYCINSVSIDFVPEKK